MYTCAAFIFAFTFAFTFADKEAACMLSPLTFLNMVYMLTR